MNFVQRTHSKTPCSFPLGMIVGILLLCICPSYAWYCYTYTEFTTNYGKCGYGYPSTSDGKCVIACRELNGGIERTFVRFSFGQINSYYSCKDWQSECANGEITDPCEIYPSASGCKTPEQECLESGKYWYNGVCNEFPELRDTTFTLCKEGLKLMSSGQYEWYVSVLNCRGQYDPNVNEIYFNEKENCGSGMEVPGSCNDHGYKQGINDDGNPAKDVKCFAISADGTVWLQSPSGEAFPCKGADGSCEIAQQKVMKGECTDGVDRTSSSSGASSSSSSSSDTSSSSSSDSTGSSSSEGETGSSGSMVDYSPILAHIDQDFHENNAYLQSINKYTQWNYNATYQVAQNTSQIAATNSQIAQNTLNLLSGVGEVNSSLVQIKDAMNVQYTPETDNNDYSVDTTTAPIIDPEEQARNDSMVSSVNRERSMVDSIRRDFDSTMRRIDSIRADTNNNYMAMDSIYNWADTNTVKKKLGKIFLPTTTTNTCFVCDKQIELFNYKARFYIDFGNFKGFDLCSFVRSVVRFITAIIVTFTTVKSFIRAFSSGGGNT